MPFKVILFDVDGMVIRSKKFSDRMREQHGIPWENMKPFFSDPFQLCKTGKADLKEELTNVVKDWGWNDTVESLLTFWFEGGSEINETIIDLVGKLRKQGTLCYLATNQEKYRLDFLWHVAGLKASFDGYFCSCDIGYMKDEPAFFEHVYRALSAKDSSIKPENILFNDDHEEYLLIARQCGLRTHLYKNFEEFEQLVTS